MVVLVATIPRHVARPDEFQDLIKRLEGKVGRDFDEDGF
jgi:hypothetical protein